MDRAGYRSISSGVVQPAGSAGPSRRAGQAANGVEAAEADADSAARHNILTRRGHIGSVGKRTQTKNSISGGVYLPMKIIPDNPLPASSLKGLMRAHAKNLLAISPTGKRHAEGVP